MSITRLQEQGKKAKQASYELGKLSSIEKNKGLIAVAEAILIQQEIIIKENKKDIEKAKDAGISGALLDRLTLNENRIIAMAEGLKQIAQLDDPIGEIAMMKKRPNGLQIGQKRVPLGVIAIIYEARPNVTADAFGLCFKAGNAVLLKGGKEALYSNMAIAEIISDALSKCGLPKDGIQFIADTDRSTTLALMKLNKYVDVLIPRGGKNLIQSVIQNSTIPIIETGAGNCHLYIDEFADLDQAISIVINAKTQRPGVCNAIETLLVHKAIDKSKFLELVEKLESHSVELRVDDQVRKWVPRLERSTERDWDEEYLDLILAIKTVSSLEEAIQHIHNYGTGHSEAIVTENYTHAQKFLDEVDAAAVYVNASTRFTDGFEFGFGAEIGISTQKLHARGPMGLKELTTTKYIIYGTGQARM
ncbi:MAG: glutamate-5-semialdehyde dehydrogenase [Epulopiscium sp.]|nr:glutamate-5-semialdehyde dehydrogenase [Candidatus Epulonipiscium sp.]